jgi:hypothetical protein
MGRMKPEHSFTVEVIARALDLHQEECLVLDACCLVVAVEMVDGQGRHRRWEPHAPFWARYMVRRLLIAKVDEATAIGALRWCLLPDSTDGQTSRVRAMTSCLLLGGDVRGLMEAA